MARVVLISERAIQSEALASALPEYGALHVIGVAIDLRTGLRLAKLECADLVLIDKPSRALLDDFDERDEPAAGEFKLPGLTNRQCAIAKLVAEGLSNREISLRLCISLATVKNHVHQVLRRLGFSRRSQLARLFSRSLAAEESVERERVRHDECGRLAGRVPPGER